MKRSVPGLRRLADAIEDVVDPSVGIVHLLEEVRREPGSPAFFHYAGQACNTEAFSCQRNFSTTGGAASDPERAMAKAIGEAVERYCAALYHMEDLPLVASESALFPHVAPEEFALYSKEQYVQSGFPWVPFTAATPVRWTSAVDLTTGQDCYVPAAMVFVPYAFYRGSGDSPITQPISTGLACHCSPSEAALSGVCEVIERDAFTITWQAKLGMPQIRVETLSDAGYDLVQRFECTGSSVVLLNITMEHRIPTILSILRSSSPEEPALVFAAAAALDPERAVCNALEELAHTRRYSKQIKSLMQRLVPEADFTNVVDQLDHLNMYCDHANLQLADFIFASPQRIDFNMVDNFSTGDSEKDLETVISRVQSVGHRILVSDLTTPDVRDVGLTVVRALIPGFHPLFMGHRIRALGGSRLSEVPQKLCHPRLPPSGDNPAPHPYP